MPNLTPEQIAAAKRAGVSNAWIAQYTTGRSVPTEISRKINDAAAPLQKVNNVRLSQPINESFFASPAPRAVSATALNNIRTSTPVNASPIQDFLTQRENALKKPAATEKTPTQKAALQKILDALGTYGRISKAYRTAKDNGTATSKSQPAQESSSSGSISMEDYPEYSGGAGGGGGGYAIPSISPRDFTSEAQRMAGEAFAPYLGSFDTAKANATTQAAQGQQATGSLYDKFVKDIATTAAEQQGQYTQAGTDAGTRANELGTTIGQNYSGANAQLAEQLGKLGLQAAAPEVLGASADDQAWQQSQAAQGGKQQQDYYATQGQGQQDYMQKYGNMQQQEGINAQGRIGQQLQQFIQNTDIAKSGALSEQAQQAIDIANQLTDRDLQSQQANAGFQMQGNQLQQSDNQAQYQADVGRYTAQQSAYQGAAQAENDQYQQDFENDLATQRLGLDTALAGGKLNSAGSTAPALNDLQGPGRAKAQLEAQYGANGTQLFNDSIKLLTDFWTQHQAGGDNNQLKAQFIDTAKNNAISRGADPSAALTAALQVWDATSR